MKKLMLVSMLVLALSGCDSNKPKTIPETDSVETVKTAIKNEPAATNKVLVNAESIVKSFKDNNLSVGQVIVYDEKTDPNKLLNRPNQYTQKIAFEDTSIDQPDPEFLMDDVSPINGGTIEVYPTEEGAIQRKAYIEQVTEGIPMLQQYIYINGTAVLRLEHDVLPADAERYNQVFQGR